MGRAHPACRRVAWRLAGVGSTVFDESLRVDFAAVRALWRIYMVVAGLGGPRGVLWTRSRQRCSPPRPRTPCGMASMCQCHVGDNGARRARPSSDSRVKKYWFLKVWSRELSLCTASVARPRVPPSLRASWTPSGATRTHVGAAAARDGWSRTSPRAHGCTALPSSSDAHSWLDQTA